MKTAFCWMCGVENEGPVYAPEAFGVIKLDSQELHHRQRAAP